MYPELQLRRNFASLYKLPPGTDLIPSLLISSFLSRISCINLACSTIMPSFLLFSAAAAASQTDSHQPFHPLSASLQALSCGVREQRTRLITLRILLQPPHKVIKVLLSSYAVLQTSLLQIRVVFQEKLLFSRGDVVNKGWAADTADGTAVSLD
jgi:hypothetical protein